MIDQVKFTVENRGAHPARSVEIELNGRIYRVRVSTTPGAQDQLTVESDNALTVHPVASNVIRVR